MRSILGFAVLVAAIGFSGCCGTGGKCGLLGLGGKLGKRAADASQGTIIEAGDCGCGEEIYSDPGMTQYSDIGGESACGCGGDTMVSASAPADCGCSGSIASGVPIVSPMEFSAPAPAGECGSGQCGSGQSSSGQCDACDGASAQRPRRFNPSGNGMGLSKNDRGIACSDGSPNGSSRITERRAARSLKSRRTKSTLKEKFGFAKTEDTIVSSEEYDLVSDEYTVGCDQCAGGVARPVISHGGFADREARRAFRGSTAGCGHGGCGHGGRLCGACDKIRGLAGLGSGNPYGGAIPHTAKQPGQSGMAPSYAYPYYTTRGPRDFLQDNPPSIGR